MEFDFGKLVVARMNELGYPRAKLAKALTGVVTKAALYSFLDGKSGINSRRLARIFRVLDITVECPPRETPDHELTVPQLLDRVGQLSKPTETDVRRVQRLWRLGQVLSELRYKSGKQWPEWVKTLTTPRRPRSAGAWMHASLRAR